MIDSCQSLGLGHGSWVMRVTGQLNDASPGSRVTKLSALNHDCTTSFVVYSSGTETESIQHTHAHRRR